MDSDKALELYYDHYKETNELCRSAKTRRDKNFIILCILEVLSLLMLWNPRLIAAVINDAIRSQIESTVQVGNNIIQTLIWVLISYTMVRYIQEALFVERQYKYVGELEKQINQLLEREVITREGSGYLKDYPPVLNIVHLFYNLLCPILFTTINIYHIILEWRNRIGILPLIADSVLCLAIIVITIFYFFEIHEKTRNNMLKWKLMLGIDKHIRKWLNGV